MLYRYCRILKVTLLLTDTKFCMYVVNVKKRAWNSWTFGRVMVSLLCYYYTVPSSLLVFSSPIFSQCFTHCFEAFYDGNFVYAWNFYPSTLNPTSFKRPSWLSSDFGTNNFIPSLKWVVHYIKAGVISFGGSLLQGWGSLLFGFISSLWKLTLLLGGCY